MKCFVSNNVLQPTSFNLIKRGMKVGHFVVYIHSDRDGNPRYVGKGSLRRAKSRQNRSIAWKEIFQDRPMDVYIVLNTECEEEALLCEILTINSLKEDGYQLANHTIGGDGVYTERSNLSADFLEFKKSLSGGQNTYWFGKKRGPISEETRIKLREAITGMKRSRKTIERMRKVASLRPKGNGNNLLGHKLSDETKEKMRKASRFNTMPRSAVEKAMATKKAKYAAGYNNKKCKPVICVETGVEYPSAHRAAEALGLCDKKISSVCTGKRKSHGKLHFKFKHAPS